MNAGRRVGGLGKMLRGHRRAAGLTQEELADQAGLSVRTVSDIERGRTARPYQRSARLLADALSLTGAAREEFFTVADTPDGAGGPGRTVPWQLPATPAQFAGRARELATLTELARAGGDAGLSNGTRPPATVIVISGTAGVGKTTLAVHWARQASDRFPDGQLYLNLRGFGPSDLPVKPDDAVRGFLAALGVPAGEIPAGLEAQAALYRSLLASRRMLVLLDNAHDAAQVRPLLPGSSPALVIVTSRDPLLTLAAAEGAHPMTLGLLAGQEARELLDGRLGPERTGREEAAATALIELCARLPLALAIAAARAAAHPEFSIASLAAELRDAAGPPGALGALEAWDRASSVRAVFSWSYANLSVPAARMFRLLGVHPGPDLTAPAAASLAGVSRARARHLLAELASTQLLAEHVPGRFACHDLLRAYAVERLHETDSAGASRDALRRTLDHYLHTAQGADWLLHPSRERTKLPPARPGVAAEDLAGYPEAFAWYQAEHQVLLAAVAHAAQAGEDAHVWQLPRAMETYFIRQCLWHDLAAAQRRALAAAVRLGDRAAQAHSYRGLGRVTALLGRREEARACLAEALIRFRELGDQVSEARAHTDAGIALGREGQFGEALGHAMRALDLYRIDGHRAGQAGALNNAGWYQVWLGRYTEALACCTEALAIFRELGDGYGAAHSLDSLGCAHCGLGDYPQGIACYTESLALFRESGDRIDQAEVLAHLAEGQHAAGDLHSAHGTWQQALAVLEEVHSEEAGPARARARRASLHFRTIAPGSGARPRVIVSGEPEGPGPPSGGKGSA